MLKPPAANDSKVLSVSQLNRLARQLLEEHFPLVQVQGEISNFAQPASGHWYLTLKDANAQVRCAMFRNRNMFVRFKPKDGLQVVVKARLSLYEGRGDYQLIVEAMEEAGAGALRQAFEQLYARLNAEGLFAPERKKPLPAWPRHVAVITSPTGAAVRDVISVFGRRFPATQLTIVPVSVQGQAAAPEMIAALAKVNQRQGCLSDVDTILLTRGGGSLEDLWSFNDETLARAIAASELPVVSAVGHEIDFTIADFVADVRAATPSAAAELLSPHQDVIGSRLHNLLVRQSSAVSTALSAARKQLLNTGKRLRHPGQRLQQQAQRLDLLELRLKRAMTRQRQSQLQTLTAFIKRLQLQRPDRQLQQKRQGLTAQLQRLVLAMRQSLRRQQQRLSATGHALNTVSPLNTLARGYSITTTDKGSVVSRYDQVEPGATIDTRLAEGSIRSRVVSTGKE
ncbi:MAG TPA: exodeoxyribonuclease VII large subunit [Candidatus Acidoferrum sp.]|nr:exodeoxyribonuclease VII large subunit [Candidatus Acidoferrum sp.]